MYVKNSMGWKATATYAVLMALLATQLFAVMAFAQEADGALSISNLQISPTPVVAGDEVNVTFNLLNSYQSTLYSVNLQVSADNPIINVSPTSSVYIPSIGTGQYGGAGVGALNYAFHIPSTLQGGEYTLDVLATYGTTTGEGALQSQTVGTSEMPIELYVYGTPSIQLTANPVGQIAPGGQSELEISAINTGTDIARNVTLTILNSSGFVAYGASTIQFGIMDVGVPTAQTVQLQTSPTLTQGTVSIPVVVNYTTEAGTKVSLRQNLTMNFVLGAPDITATIASAKPEQLYPGSNQTLTVQLQNTGYATAKNLSVSFLSGQGVTVQSSSPTFYIGTLAEGASTTEQISVFAASGANLTNYTIPVKVTYGTLASGSQTTVIDKMPISLQQSSIFNVTAVTSTLVPGGTYEPITFTIKNNGNEPAQQASIVLQTVFPISPVDPNFYVASLLPGQSVNATFYVSVDTDAQNGTYPVTLYEQWRQPNGATSAQYSGSNNYFAAVSTGSSSSSGNTLLYEIAAVVIIVAAAVIYRKRAKAKRIKKKAAEQMEPAPHEEVKAGEKRGKASAHRKSGA